MCKNDENYKFLSNDINLFDSLREGIDSLVIPNNYDEKLNTIFFVGNTGSGKTTLFLLLASDIRKLYSKANYEGSDEYFIVHNENKIGIDPVNSQTTYPELLVDKETGILLCDNPGFRDTRTAIHEIIEMYSMRKILKHTKKIKIVMVITHSSLKLNENKEDFQNHLKHVSDLFLDINKYKKSIYLIATKADNKLIFENGKQIMAPDINIINNIGHFLKDVKISFTNSKNTFNKQEKVIFYEKATKIIDSLLKKSDSDSYDRINILRRPMKTGKLSEIDILQDERSNIRNMLLTNENFVEVSEDDFGFALTNDALLYLEDIFKKLNSYIINLSEIISKYLLSYYNNLVDSTTDINFVTTMLLNTKKNINKFSYELGLCKNPEEYLKIIDNFSKKYNLKLDCLIALKNITILNNYFIQLEDLLAETKYTPSTWNMPINILSDFIDNKLEQYSLLRDAFKILSSHKFQNIRQTFISEYEIVNNYNIKNFLETTNLNERYDSMNIFIDTYEKLNIIINLLLKHEINVMCENESLIIMDYIILFSELNKSLFYESCENVNNIYIIAMHTVIIDEDLTDELFSGKKLTIIAPVWDIIGSRVISVNGLNGGEALPKAEFGKIGNDGKNGKSGGIFIGIGMNFNNGENLKITANGGNGQDGQDGGDGRNGSDGYGYEDMDNSRDFNGIIIINKEYNKHYKRGSKGERGGNSGEGGRGGFGGNKGYVKLYSINDEHKISILTENGKQGLSGKDGIPGKGGVKACDNIIEETVTLFFIIPINSDKEIRYSNCNERSPDGYVLRRNTEEEYKPVKEDNITKDDIPICIRVMIFEKYFLKKYSKFLSDGTTMTFINKLRTTKF